MVEQRAQLDKFGVAAALQEIARLMELKGGQYRFKAKAYNAGARSIQAVGDLDRLVKKNLLTTLPRIGGALASQITQLYETGESSVLNQLREEFPPGVVELSAVPGLSLSKAQQLHEQLGIASVEELKAAAEAGQIRDLKGFGPKTEQRLLEVLSKEAEQPTQRLHLHHALNTGEQIVEFMKTARGLVDISFAGSLRRWKETVGTIEIVAGSKKPETLIEHFLRYPHIVSNTQNENNVVALFVDNARVSFTAVTPAEFAVTLFLKTGSSSHLEQLPHIEFAKIPKTEEAIYDRLRMQYVPPELRENEGEIEAALEGKLPEDLVTLADVKGMVHCHTTYSDGKHSLEAMVRGAEAMGMKYITITDHSPTAFYAGGVKIDDLRRQWDEIDELQDQVKIKILRGTESDILADGRLDYPDDILEQFDVIVASVHSRYKMNGEKMTERVITAMRQPVFKIWGHALGRLIERRPPFDCDVLRILDAIAESNAAVEINGDPYRLDMEPRWVREARKRKIKFLISVDAHSVGAMNNLKFGVAMARRGWVRRGEVLNTLAPVAFQKAVRPV